MAKKRRGNPDWGKTMGLPTRIDPPEFELVMAKLNLKVESCLDSEAMRQWIRQNHRTRYVPEKVLKNMGIDPHWILDASYNWSVRSETL